MCIKELYQPHELTPVHLLKGQHAAVGITGISSKAHMDLSALPVQSFLQTFNSSSLWL